MCYICAKYGIDQGQNLCLQQPYFDARMISGIEVSPAGARSLLSSLPVRAYLAAEEAAEEEHGEEVSLTLAAQYIFNELVPEWKQEFTNRNTEYGEYDSELGPLGEVVELLRKVKKLKRAFIDKCDTDSWAEDPRQIAMDLVGHAFLLLMLLDEEGLGDDPAQTWPPMGGAGV